MQGEIVMAEEWKDNLIPSKNVSTIFRHIFERAFIQLPEINQIRIKK